MIFPCLKIGLLKGISKTVLHVSSRPFYSISDSLPRYVFMQPAAYSSLMCLMSASSPAFKHMLLFSHKFTHLFTFACLHTSISCQCLRPGDSRYLWHFRPVSLTLWVTCWLVWFTPSLTSVRRMLSAHLWNARNVTAGFPELPARLSRQHNSIEQRVLASLWHGKAV